MRFKNKIFLEQKEVPESFVKDAIGIAYRKVKTTQLRAISYNHNKLNSRKITQTPHYHYAVKNFNPTKSIENDNVQSYEEFRNKATNGRESENNRFLELISSLNEKNYDWEKRPILVVKHPFRPFHFNIVDGMHRAAILTAKGTTHFVVLQIKSKKSLLNRTINFLKKIGK